MQAQHRTQYPEAVADRSTGGEALLCSDRSPHPRDTEQVMHKRPDQGVENQKLCTPLFFCIVMFLPSGKQTQLVQVKKHRKPNLETATASCRPQVERKVCKTYTGSEATFPKHGQVSNKALNYEIRILKNPRTLPFSLCCTLCFASGDRFNTEQPHTPR